jgi:intein-encoded DNA endonuclease-like protein
MKAVEIQVINESKKGKNRENLPDELRIKIYERVIELHQQGLSYNKIVKIIEQEFGVRLPKSTVGRWIQGRNKPYNRIYIPSLKLLEPSEELAYVIGVMIGDGYIYKYIYAFRDGRIVERYRIGLKAKDKEFVGEFARCLAIVLNRPSIKGTEKFYLRPFGMGLWP